MDSLAAGITIQKCAGKADVPSVPKKILIVDDERHVRELISKFLSPRGYTVLLAGNGEEGMTSIRSERPDLVFLDIIMPGKDGLEVLQDIKRDYPDLPVIIFSALHEEETAKEAIRLGAYDYMTKPFKLESLLKDFIERILG